MLSYLWKMIPVRPAPLEELFHPMLSEKRITLFVQREDLIHPEVMGNKWYKLKYNLCAVQAGTYKGIVTIGGAYSNHIASTAAAARMAGLACIGLIRGDELNTSSNATLKRAAENGMHLRFVDRERFRTLRDHPHRARHAYPGWYFMPEGGTNRQAIRGCMEMVRNIPVDFDVIVTPVGTGGTFCGLVKGAKKRQKVIGISALKGAFIRDSVDALMRRYRIPWGHAEMLTGYHFGGYAKTDDRLSRFTEGFTSAFGIPLDPVYTAKSFFAVWDRIGANRVKRNTRIVLLHTGGLQGVKPHALTKKDNAHLQH